MTRRVSSSGGGQGGSFPPKNLTLNKLRIIITEKLTKTNHFFIKIKYYLKKIQRN
jgi:hypothetical protein